MTTSGDIALAVLSVVFYVCGGLCIFKTKLLVAWRQSSYTKSKFVQSYPFFNMVTKSWYPVYIRCAGVFIWLWALTVDYLVLFRGFHQPVEIRPTHFPRVVDHTLENRWSIFRIISSAH